MSVTKLSVQSLAPNLEVVAALEDLLAQARAGTIRGIALLTNEPQLNQSGHTCVGEWSAPLALWAVETFKHRHLHKWQSGLDP